MSDDSTPIARKSPPKLPKDKSLGRAAYSDKHLEAQFTQPLTSKQHLVRDTWANTSIVLAMRAQKAAQSYGKKDFNALYRLVLSASIAMDKAFPQQVQPLGTNLVVQLFSSLGHQTTKAILEPTHPTLDITPISEPTEVALPKVEPLDDNP
jgi:hypothetical protein